MQSAGEFEKEEAKVPEGGNGVSSEARGDLWPADAGEREALIAEIDQKERLRMRGIGPDPLRRARIVDQAIEVLLRRLERGDLPERPRAWLRAAVNNSLKSRKIAYGNDWTEFDLVQATVGSEEGDGDPARRALHARREWLMEHLDELGLTERECGMVRAALECRSIKGAAGALGMGASNFRRDLEKLGTKISAKIRGGFGKSSRKFDPPPPKVTS